MKPLSAIVGHIKILVGYVLYNRAFLDPHGCKSRIVPAQIASMVCLMLPGILSGTCAVAVWTPTRIVLGADGKSETTSANLPSVFNVQCKIHQVGRYYVLFSGLSENQATYFNAWNIISDSVNRTSSVFDAANLATAELERGFARVLDYARRNTNAGYVAGLEQNAPLFAIAGFDRGVAYLAHCSYNKTGVYWTWKKELFPQSNDGPGSIAFTYLCGSKGIAAFKRQHPQWLTDDPVRTVTGMIAAQAQVDGDHVGPPISIVDMNAFSASGGCGSNDNRKK